MEWKISEKPVDYEEALAFMDERVAGIHDGRSEECIWLLEHPAMYTAGTSAKAEDLLNPAFPVYASGRGGQYTYHGPGQRVVYVMLDLKKRQKVPDIKEYVCNLERWVIAALGEFGIRGHCREGQVGIWTETLGSVAKIAAIGVRVRHWVTLHGISVNVNPDLAHYAGIVPCGISELGVTSMQALGIKANLEALDQALKKHAAIVAGRVDFG
jgi:lipoyl(octanoyl) transferase